jgi:hypothetical protein
MNVREDLRRYFNETNQSCKHAVTEKKTIVMPDGRDRELEVLLEPGRGSNFTTTQSITIHYGR